MLLFFTLPVLAENTILIVGDSLSAGYGLQPGEGWVTLLEKRLAKEGYAYRVVNSSISGDTTSNGLARLPGLLKQYQPQITIIELGGNDGLRGLQLLVIRRNLQGMVALAIKAGSKVLLLGVQLPPNYGEDYVSQFQSLYAELADKNTIALVANFLHGIDDNKNLMASDGIHPLAAAQPLILGNVWPTLHGLLK